MISGSGRFPRGGNGHPLQYARLENSTDRGTWQAAVHGVEMTKQLTHTHPWAGKIPWRRKWQPTLVLLSEESHGQRSLTGYSLWYSKELSVTADDEHDSQALQQREKSQRRQLSWWITSLVIFKEMTPKKDILLISVFTFLLNKVKFIPKFPQVCILKRSLVPRACLP